MREGQKTGTSVLADLSAVLPGCVLVPGDREYESAKQVWNARIDARPGAIVRCRTEGDVATAIRVAVDHGQHVAVRGGGHSVAGHGTSHGGIVLHLDGLDEIEVDPNTRGARVGGGLSWGPVDAATAKYGLATVGGQISTTGVGGLTVGGGIGWLMRKHGLTVDNLRSASVVDAGGQHRVASEFEDRDLFWAIRGGGGNFGVVTEFEFDLHPVSDILGGTLLYGMDRAEEVMDTFRRVAEDAPTS